MKYQLLIILTALTILLFTKIRKLVLIIPLLYFGIHTLYTTRPEYIFPYNPNLTNVVQNQSLSIILSFIGVTFLVPYFDKIKLLIPWFIIADMISLFLGYWGVEGTTFDVAVCAMLLPLILTKRGSWYEALSIALTISGAIYFHSRSAYVIFLIQFIWIVRQYWKYLLLATPLVYFVFPISSNGRISMWMHYMTWWEANANHWIGTGLGSFHWMGLTMLDSGREAKFYLIHNDWLQILFETGYIGVAAALTLYVYTLLKLKATNRLVWITFGVLGLTYYPIHHLLVQVIAAYFMFGKTNTASLNHR